MFGGFILRGYTQTLAEPRVYDMFLLCAVARSRPAARRVYRPSATQGIEIISWL